MVRQKLIWEISSFDSYVSHHLVDFLLTVEWILMEFDRIHMSQLIFLQKSTIEREVLPVAINHD